MRVYRNATTGDRGFLVRMDDRDWIRMDRGAGVEDLRPYRASDWIEERETRRLSAAAVARVAFDADRALCAALGLVKESRRDWLSLSDSERIQWMNDGPPDDPRSALRSAVIAALEGV